MLIDRLQQDLNASLKAGKSIRVETIRFLIAAVRNAAIAKYWGKADTSLTDADIVEVVKKQIKTHKESIEAFKKAGRTELVDKEKQELLEALRYPPKDGGLWNGVKVAAWIKEKTGRDFIYPQRGWQYLVNLGFSLKVPRPTHKKTSKKIQNGFKKLNACL